VFHKGGSSPRSILIKALALAALIPVAVGCGSTSNKSSSSSSTSSASTTASGGGISQQVAAAQAQCRGEEDPLASKLQNDQAKEWLRGRQIIPIVESPWGDGSVKPRANPNGPWKVGFSNSFAGNDARQDVIRAMKDQTAAYKAAGKVSGLESTLSNGDVAKHNNQINQLVADGVDVILDLSPGKDATTRAIDAAGKAGVPVVTMDAPVVSKYAVNVSTANWLQSVDSAGWMIQQMGGQGTIVTVQGIKGEPGSEIWEASAACMFSKFPKIKILANIYGSWTEPVAKTEMQKVLTTNPGAKIDGVWVQGPGTTGVIQAFEQTGRPVPKYMTNFGQKAVLAYWRDHRSAVHMYSASQPPYESTVEAYQVMIRILSGQKPILNTIYSLGPAITDDTLDGWVKPEDKWPSARGFAAVDQEKWMPQDTLNGYFSNGQPVQP
jgi:ribose transport system substrate-binding protein